ncbi:MAG: ATP-binding protein [Acidobacteria bacterium]|nr:ATP-binding protein [Acidobacteriota bacterium]
MQDFEKLGIFYLGREYNLTTKQGKDNLVLYDSRHMVTHAVCVGMTGSGKTGLCLALLEEAAMDNIPALIIDPKGDLGNLLLTFPDLKPEDFRPWINEDDARRKGLSADDFASQQAELWSNGLGQWGQDGKRIAALREKCELAIYTPGSDAGIPISVLRSCDAPPQEVIEDRELFRDRIGATATALLGLIGVDADPIQSREHILLSNLFDAAWRQGQSLDLPALIHQIQTPPMTKIGVLDVDGFFPAKERFVLAMQINNLLASPGFEVWLSGEPLDVQSLLFNAQGKPKLSVLSIAHLNDSERMFFVSLLLNQTLSWMRQQSGTTSLRAILYMDEIFGYFPPIGEPPAKRPLLTLLKQARAYGIGIMLATQNPVDLDYKGLSNTGTWFIGRLQTDRDKMRVLDGLEGAVATAGGASFDRQEMDRILSGLGNRIFLMNDVHAGQPVVFESRWAMSYLRGPLTRSQIKTLMADHKASQPIPAGGKSKAAAITGNRAAARPVLPPDIPQHFIPARATDGAGITYKAVLYGAAQVKFLDPKKGVDLAKTISIIAPITTDATPVSWEDAEETETTADELEGAPVEGAGFAELPPAAAKAKSYAAWSKDFSNWIFANQKLDLFVSPSTGEMSRQEESERDFRARLQLVAREHRDSDLEAIRARYATKVASLEEKIRRAEQAMEKQQQESSSAKLETAVSIGAGILGAIFGSKRGGTSAVLGKVAGAAKGVQRARRQSQDVDFASENLGTLMQMKADMEAEIKEQTDAVTNSVDASKEQLQTVSIRPKKVNVSVRLCSLAWMPVEGAPSN